MLAMLGPSPPARASGSASLLGLPSELRQEIIRYVIAPCGHVYLYNTAGTYAQRPCSMANLTPMLVSKSIRADAEEVLYGQTIFIVEIRWTKCSYVGPTDCLSNNVSNHVLRRVQRLAIFNTVDYSCRPSDHLPGFHQMTAVRNVQIALSTRCDPPSHHQLEELARILLPIRGIVECMPSTAKIHIGIETSLMERLLKQHNRVGCEYLTLYGKQYQPDARAIMAIAQRNKHWLCEAQGRSSGLPEPEWQRSLGRESEVSQIIAKYEAQEAEELVRFDYNKSSTSRLMSLSVLVEPSGKSTLQSYLEDTLVAIMLRTLLGASWADIALSQLLRKACTIACRALARRLLGW